MSNQIEIKIESAKLTPQQFLEASQSFLAIVLGVSKNISGRPLNWTVEVERGSAVLRLLSDDLSESAEAISAVKQGLKSLSSGVRAMPVGFTQAEMRSLRVLASLRQAEGMREILIQDAAAAEPVAENIISVIDLIATRGSHDEYGSIEGMVAALSLRQGFICTIQDPVEQREISCYLQNQESQNTVLKAVSTRSRILADGLVHYSKEGIPVSITADFVRMFPDETQLPTLADVQAIYKQYR